MSQGEAGQIITSSLGFQFQEGGVKANMITTQSSKTKQNGDPKEHMEWTEKGNTQNA